MSIDVIHGSILIVVVVTVKWNWCSSQGHSKYKTMVLSESYHISHHRQLFCLFNITANLLKTPGIWITCPSSGEFTDNGWILHTKGQLRAVTPSTARVMTITFTCLFFHSFVRQWFFISFLLARWRHPKWTTRNLAAIRVLKKWTDVTHICINELDSHWFS